MKPTKHILFLCWIKANRGEIGQNTLLTDAIFRRERNKEKKTRNTTNKQKRERRTHAYTRTRFPCISPRQNDKSESHLI